MIRGIVQSVAEGVIKRFTASGRGGETIANREYFQHYGYTSRPKQGAEIIIIREGGHFLAIASDDRRYRIALEDGEVALYDDLGQEVHLARGGIRITSPLAVTVIAPDVNIVAENKVTMTTPLLDVSGNIVAGGDISDASGTKSMSGMRETYDSHTHPENGTGGGTTSAPNEAM